MAEPFVFHFDRDSRGFPTLMTIADVQGECGLCKHDEIQRFYRAVPFHSMTLDGLRDVAFQIPSWAEYVCANCGSEVGPEHVVASTFVWGFTDDSGLLRIYGTGDSARFEFVPDRRLDPQELPGFEPPATPLVFDAIDDSVVEEELGRPFNLKVAIREFVQEVFADDEPGVWAPLGKSMWIVNGTLADLPTLDLPEDPTCVEVRLDSPPAGLSTLPEAVAMPGRVETWLPEGVPEKVRIVVDLRAIHDALSLAFDVARLTFDADESAVRNIVTPMEQAYPHDLAYLAIAQRAAYTGISPGEAARLTAEEVVGPLLNLKRSKLKTRK
jgi:hypothetical protein